MASRAKHERNELRKKDVANRKNILTTKKETLKSSRKVENYTSIVENIKQKLNSGLLTQLQKDVLNKEMSIYQSKIDTFTVDNATMWKMQFEINALGKEMGCCKIRRRCNIPTCSRPRSVFKQFGLCRLHIRELAGKRLLIGRIRKESW